MRISGILLLAFILVMSFTVSVMANNNVKVIVDGKQLGFDVQPIIQNERVLVPMRAIFEELNAEVQWDATNRLVTGIKGDITIELTIDDKIAKKNDSLITLDTPAIIIEGRTMIPIRFIAESLGCEVNWDGINRIVDIKSKENDQEDISNIISLSEIIKGRWLYEGDNSSLIEFTDNEFKIGWYESEWGAFWTYEINSIDEKENTLKITVSKDNGEKEKYTVKIYAMSESRLSLNLIDSNGKDTMWIQLLEHIGE